ncbi:DUF1652 domain-containing protein [Pseudomonas sp. W2I6]|uniref:DUF1652 domain-containing protein n=1 Tax=Pseudomonas sp. W2I6 TaxID=3042289 RepID=UPI0027D7DBC6|nr:DUF1652 domain-containing protein [Pseudomonas sp. W2I6]
MMISFLELKHILEMAFSPTRCVCDIDTNRTLTIRLIDPTTQQVQLTLSGIDAGSLTSSRAIARLVGEIKDEASLQASPPVKRTQRK